MNLAAFLWGRRAAHDLAAVNRLLARRNAPKPETLDDVIARRVAFLTDYQDTAYAEAYRQFVAEIHGKTDEPFAMAVARNLFKLMAYKDEYEVARLYAEGRFARDVAKRFTGDFKLTFHLAPPFGGNREKKTFGPWLFGLMRLLASMKRLRGTVFDIFGRSAERRMERAMIADYRNMVTGISARLTPGNHKTALLLVNLPDNIRGFGHVKAASIAAAEKQRHALLAQFEASGLRKSAAE
jgi:indolepyruvate ferredoxin oxidoreductase